MGAVCCLKRDRYATAGALLGLAAMLRIFPAWFAVPIALHALTDAISRRQVSPRHVRFLLAFAVACASLFAATLALPAGLQHWQDFRHNMQRHVESNAYNSIGLNEILSFTGPVKASNAEGFARELDWRRTTYRAQIAVVLLVLIAVLRRRSRWPDDAPATVLAIPLLFCTLSLAAYYYAFLILLVLAHGQSAWRIASLFGVEVATGVLGIVREQPDRAVLLPQRPGGVSCCSRSTWAGFPRPGATRDAAARRRRRAAAALQRARICVADDIAGTAAARLKRWPKMLELLDPSRRTRRFATPR